MIKEDNYLEAATAGAGGLHAGVPVLLLANPALHLSRRATTQGAMAVLDGHRLLMQIDHPLPTADRRLQRRLCQQPVHDQREMVAHRSCEHAIHGSGKQCHHLHELQTLETEKQSNANHNCQIEIVFETSVRVPRGRPRTQ